MFNHIWYSPSFIFNYLQSTNEPLVNRRKSISSGVGWWSLFLTDEYAIPLICSIGVDVRQVWTDKIDELAIKQGENLSVSIDIESREYNGRWYTDVKAWKVSRVGVSADNIQLAEPEEYSNTQQDEPPLLDDVIPF